MGADSPTDKESAARWALRVLGGFELTELATGQRLTGLGKRERVLLAYLAVAPNCRENRRKLATLLWGDASDETALDNLRTCVWGLRKALGDTAHRIVASEGECIVLDSIVFEVDALNFRRSAAATDAAELRAAVELYGGEFLDGLGIENEEFESWRRSTANSLRDSAVDAAGRLLKHLFETGDIEGAIRSGLRLLQIDPLNELAARHLMRLYARSGRRSAAIQVYRTLADSLKAELDARPDVETRTIYAEIARGGDDRPPEPAAPAEPVVAPPTIARPVRSGFAQPENALRFPLPAVVAALVVIALLLFSYRDLPLFRGTGAIVTEQASSVSAANAISIAVLPFDNISGDASQEFFSDGMTEEITTVLAKIPDLRVVARQSASQFRGERKDLRAVGKALGATHLIEGSVRKDGNRVRITAQLIRAADGTHVWADAYDRELKDVFAIQEDIAAAIAGALRTPLGLKPGEQLVAGRDIDPDSYETLLRARALIQGRGLQRLTEATGLLEQIVARYPGYAPAWLDLARAYSLTPNASPERNGSAAEFQRVADVFMPKAKAAAQRAIELDPGFARGYAVLAGLEYQEGRPLQGEPYRAKALALDPSLGGGEQVASLGYLKQGLALHEKLRSIEPFIPVINDQMAVILWVNGKNDEALALAKSLPPNRWGRVAMIYASMGRFREAADTLAGLRGGGVTTPSGPFAEAARLLRSAPAKVESPEKLPELGSILSWVYLYIGAPDRVLGSYEALLEGGRMPGQEIIYLWHPSYAPVRKTERFKAFMRKAGFVEYWRAKGWPDLCHPVGTDLSTEAQRAKVDDFECE